MKKLAFVFVILLVVGIIYSAGYESGKDALTPVSKPESGTILYGKEYDGSEIEVTASGSSDCVVLLKDSNGEVCTSFYVRAGDTVTVGVPSKYLYVFFAAGKEWYGYGEGLMFGKNTSYTKDNEICDFVNSTWSYTLTKSEDGNFSPKSSDENEFFQ